MLLLPPSSRLHTTKRKYPSPAINVVMRITGVSGYQVCPQIPGCKEKRNTALYVPCQVS